MSLVGTRPPTVDEWDKYELHHRARLATKPGLTGMWQVSGRSNITDFEEVVKLDKQYISEWTMLQAYATYVKFVELGYDCEFLCYRKKLNMIQKIKWLPRLLNKYLMKEKFRLIEKKIQLKKHPDIKMKDAIRQRAFDRFLENFLKDKVSAPYIGFEALKAGSKNYDVVVAGGDQLWIPAGLPTNFFNLMFADEKVKRVSYSTSFGVTEVPFYQKRRTIEYLNALAILEANEHTIYDPPAVFDSNKSEILLSTENKLKEIYEVFPNEGKVVLGYSYLVSWNYVTWLDFPRPIDEELIPLFKKWIRKFPENKLELMEYYSFILFEKWLYMDSLDNISEANKIYYEIKAIADELSKDYADNQVTQMLSMGIVRKL